MRELTRWDARFLLLAGHVASWSKDPSTHVGAVLVGKDRRNVTFGYNGFPPGVPDDPGHLADREVRLLLTQHAERNALDNARFNPYGGTLYVTVFPCASCARSIVARGVARLVCPPAKEHKPWAADWETETRWALYMLEHGGVEVMPAEITPIGRTSLKALDFSLR